MQSLLSIKEKLVRGAVYKKILLSGIIREGGFSLIILFDKFRILL